MTDNEMQQLQALLLKGTDISLSADMVLNIQFADCTDRDVLLLRQLQALAQAGELAASIDTVDYSRYFPAVEQSQLFKPGNPSLAILQVAKRYALDLPAFKRAFLARNVSS